MTLDRLLPVGCKWESLGDIVVDGPTNGYSGSTGSDATGSPTLRLSATSSGACVLDETTTKRLYETIPSDSNLWLEPGDLLVQRSNTIDLVGTAAIYNGPRHAYIYPDLMMRLRLREAETASFVWRYMNSAAGRIFFLRMAAGSSGSMPKISGAKLRTMQVPVPPLAEQRRIAEVLDRAEALRAKRRAALTQLDDLTQATFFDLFGDPARNTKRLPTASLGELGEWQSGGTPSRGRADYFKGSIPWFSSGELNEMVSLESKEHISDAALRETTTKLVPEGSLMLGMYDTAALKASIAGVSCSCNQAIAFSKIDPQIAEVVFVYFSIVIGREHFRRLQRGVRQKNLNLSMIREICIPLPPLALQREFIHRIAAVEKLKAAHRASLAELDALFSALQHRAFRGEL